MTIFSAFRLSAKSRQSWASFFESICGDFAATALKDKADCCGSLRLRTAAPDGQSANSPSLAPEFARKKRPLENLLTFVREMVLEMAPAILPVAERRQIPRASTIQRLR